MEIPWNAAADKESWATAPTPQPEGPGALLASVREDVQAVLGNDPAARNVWEVVLTYPGLHALWLHRVAHGLWRRGQHTRARLLSHLGRTLTGVEIHPGATIGRRVFIDHGMGVVIGETAIIGDECLIYKGVLLGGTSLERTKRHPTLGRRVVVGSNACILGRLVIGDGAKIGSGSVVVRDVPPGNTAVGVPGRIVSTTTHSNPLDHGDLPDPMATLVRSLLEQIEELQGRVEAMEGRHRDLVDACTADPDADSPSPEDRAARMAQEERQQHEELAALFFEGITGD